MPILSRRTYLPPQNYCLGTNDKKHGQTFRAVLYLMHFCIDTAIKKGIMGIVWSYHILINTCIHKENKSHISLRSKINVLHNFLVR